MSLPSRLLGANPSIQVSDALTGSFTVPSRKTPFKGGAFESISTITASGSATNFTFSSIPSDFKHLQIRGVVRIISAGSIQSSIRLEINGDTTSANYKSHESYADSASSSTGNISLGAFWFLGRFPASDASANLVGPFILDIFNYADSNKKKTGKITYGYENTTGGTGVSGFAHFFYNSTSTITSLKLFTTATGITDNTRFELYGLRG